jgi:hypothetical protein
MMKKFANALMALSMVAGMTVAVAPEAQARRGFGAGVAAGVGLGLLGAAAMSRGYYGPHYYYDDGCYHGPRECHRTHRRCFENEFGDLVCRGGGMVCERPLICD